MPGVSRIASDGAADPRGGDRRVCGALLFPPVGRFSKRAPGRPGRSGPLRRESADLTWTGEWPGYSRLAQAPPEHLPDAQAIPFWQPLW